MAARKLQTEIERTLKKVAEGVEVFEGIFDKIQQSTNQTQKEKLEVELKSQIKKLQRLRDQIKTWVQSNDIKDKQPLMDNRKLIETQMERFKACEKEMKTKAFSKEGLNAAAKLDPKEQQKLELCQWITTMVDELSRQVEQTEAEIEGLQLLKKKKDSDREQRLDELEALNERRGWHVARLELILRLLENGNLQTEAVTDVRDDIAYFVESNTEEDFEEDEGIYDDLNLQEEEDLFGAGNDDIQSSHDSVSVADETPAPSSIPPTPVAAPPVPLPTPRTPAKEASKPSQPETPAAAATKAKSGPSPTARKPTLDSTTPRPILSTPVRASSIPTPASASPAPRTAPAPLPPIRYAAAAAAANAPLPSPSLPPPTPTSSLPHPPPTLSLPPQGLQPAPPASVSTASTTESRQPSTTSSPEMMKASLPDLATLALSEHAPSPMMAARSAGTPVSASPALSAASHVLPATSAPSPLAPSPAPTAASLPSTTSVPEPEQPAESPSAPTSEPQQPTPLPPVARSNEPRLPSSLADLVTSFESAKQKSMRRENDLGSLHAILDAGFSSVPQPLDAEKPKYYVPRQPFVTPGYYPQEPSGQFANPALFTKFDVDTLFYIFYYCQGTYLQFLAASELKKQSWRFHKQYLTWFQRANEPSQITDEYEQGVYLYFDWEGSWCQRRKSDFRFEYRYLESE